MIVVHLHFGKHFESKAKQMVEELVEFARETMRDLQEEARKKD